MALPIYSNEVISVSCIDPVDDTAFDISETCPESRPVRYEIAEGYPRMEIVTEPMNNKYLGGIEHTCSLITDGSEQAECRESDTEAPHVR